MTEKTTIAWLVGGLRADIASFRYRAAYPAAVLEQRGWTCFVTDRAADLSSRIDTLAALVIVKRLDPGMLTAVSQAVDNGVPVILDLCDDVLGVDYRGEGHEVNRMVFDAIAPRLAALVTTGETLKRRFAEYGFPERKIHITPDIVETAEALALTARFTARRQTQAAVGRNRLRDGARRILGTVRQVALTIRYPRRSALEWRKTLQRISTGRPDPDAAHGAGAVEAAFALRQAEALTDPIVVWFGNHGGPHSDYGMLTLLRVAQEMRRAHARSPFTLVIVSDHRDKWRYFIEPIGVPTVFVPWTQDGCRALLERASAFLMPVGEDDFSRAKSANRALLAFETNTPIVAEALESLDPYAAFVSVGDIENGLVAALDDPARTRDRMLAAQRRSEELAGLDALADAWTAVLAAAKPYQKDRLQYGAARRAETAMVLINLVQDRPLALPVIDGLRHRGIEVGVIVSEEAVAGDRRILEALIERRISPTYATKADARRLDFRWLRGASMLFCPSETSEPAHVVAHALTQKANAAGVRTFTVQHGFENVGLTALNVRGAAAAVASQTIFTWAEPALLPGWLDAGIRARCVGVGRLRERICEQEPFGFSYDGPVLAAFENLHWKRYPGEYKLGFAERLNAVAAAFPNLKVVVAPHPAGAWGAKRGQTCFDSAVEILPPAQVSAAAVIRAAAGVITTPSTIAVDAAELGKPVAVAGHDLDGMDMYRPLPILESLEDWMAFAKMVSGPHTAPDYSEFLARVRIGGDPVERIVDIMLAGGKPADAASDYPHADRTIARR